MKVAFLDVDGVVRENDRSIDGGPYYVLGIKDVVFRPGVLDTLKILHECGYKVFWVTMQNCIMEGLVTKNQVEGIFAYMSWEVRKHGGYITDCAICTTNTEDAKAKIFAKCDATMSLIKQYDIDVNESFGVGDAISDIEAFRYAGIPDMNLFHIDIPRGDKMPDIMWSVPSLQDAVGVYFSINNHRFIEV